MKSFEKIYHSVIPPWYLSNTCGPFLFLTFVQLILRDYRQTNPYRTGKLSKRRGEQDLAGDGAVGVEPGIAEGDEIEVDDGDQPVAEYLGEVVHDEAGTEGAQRLVVQRQRDLPTGNSNGRGEDMAEEEEEEEEEAGVPSHWEKDKTVLLAREVALLVATAGIPRFSLQDNLSLEVLPGHWYKTNMLLPAKGATLLPLQFLLWGGIGGRLNGCSR
ncbi:hypothetical protein BHM03_00033877 [Ensete ventricosum]|nr:hypothetical protein BHM03_00033877 [Ensete ventricosum]